MPESTKKSELYNIKLFNFRNFSHLEFSPSASTVLIYGSNGIGKTNLIEAVSLLVPGRGIRGVKLSEMNINHSSKPWRVESQLSSGYGRYSLGVTIGALQKNVSKEYFFDGIKVTSQSKISDNLSISWLTPQMDQVFLEGNSDKKKFFDRIICGFVKNHSSALAKYSYLIKERINIIKMKSYDRKWLEVVERKIAETYLVIAEARNNFCEYLNNIIQHLEIKMPKARIVFKGEIEQSIGLTSALKLEDKICEILQHSREIDRASGRTNASFHRSDLIVYDSAKNVDAKRCSTGEQKSLLISIFLGEVFAHIKWRNRVPIILLDDIMSHLDAQKRAMIFEVIEGLGAQVFVTAVDADLPHLGKEIQKISIKNGSVI